MDFQINQDDIAQIITNQVLKEIEESNATFTNEEIKEKINAKLDEIFKKYSANKDNIKKKNDEDNEKIIEKEFTDINEFGNSVTEDDKFDSLLESIEEDYGTSEETAEGKLSDNVEENEPKNKKKFFEEFTDLYKNELQNSIDSFKNAYESFKLMKKTSIVEKVLILLFLAVPAIFGGLLTLLFILIILFLWQIHILLKVFIKFFDRIEASIKETIVKIKKKINTLKSSGGFFNRLIFSNSLYSLIMFNGILYMLVKGMLLPLKSAAEIDRILANLVSKGVRVVNMSLKGPSELALANLNGNALRSGKTTLKENAKGRNKLQLKDLLKARQNLLKNNKNMAKKVEAVKIMVVKGNIAKNINSKLQAAQKDLIEQKLNALGERTDTPKVPSSVKLSNSEKERMDISNLGKMIFDNVLDGVKDRIAGREPGREFNPLGSMVADKFGENNKSNNSDLQKEIEKDISKRTEDNQQQERNGLNLMHKALDNPQQVEAINKIYTDGGPISEAINKSGIEMTQDEKLLFAFGRADENHAKEELAENYDLSKFTETHKDATMLDYRQYKVEDAKRDREEEEREFEKWYDGKSCKDIFAKAMDDCGYDRNTILSDQQVYEVAKHAVSDPDNGFSEDQQVNAMKDLRKYNLTFKEYESCKSELEAEKSKSTSNQQETFARKESSRKSQGGGYRELSAD